jgi:UDP-N-acetylglucosamine diphosphorylase / glucose-1-phosphate thymidylyltransferase / UDP-N-acetylgalactosamine diphosphorylase / glucosamine-1-phosphate N-acetyltransferase / galactosamine-1-phosphate N-acetyltransferase
MIEQALIPAAGRGLRARPKSRLVPKVLFEIDGKSIIQRNIEMLRDQLGIREVVVIIGYEKDQIVQSIGNGEALGVAIRYVECPNPDMGLAKGILLARPYLAERFVMVLGDTVYHDSNHRDLLSLLSYDFEAVCSVLYTTELHEIKQSFAVVLENNRIVSLIEKPTVIENNWLGCGTYVFTSKIFDAIEQTPRSSRSGRVELTDAINALAQQSPGVLAFYLKGLTFNVNTLDDYHYAHYKIRATRFPQYRVSIVVPAYNEAESIAHVVRDFKQVADEVLVVNNSSTDETVARAREAGARVETVRLNGYGDTIRYGLDHAEGDIFVIVEADYSFRSRDLRKLIEYLKDADMVVGTRTTRQLVGQGTNMRGLVRWGNVMVGKLVELLWWKYQPRFTDVGCTYRALWKETYRSIKPFLYGVGPELSPEMMIAVLQAQRRVIEVPVSYHRRIGGESKHSANYLAISRTALRMLKTIGRKWVGF